MATQLATIAENITPADIKIGRDIKNRRDARIEAQSRDIADDAAEYLESRGIIARFDLSHYLS